MFFINLRKQSSRWKDVLDGVHSFTYHTKLHVQMVSLMIKNNVRNIKKTPKSELKFNLKSVHLLVYFTYLCYNARYKKREKT